MQPRINNGQLGTTGRASVFSGRSDQSWGMMPAELVLGAVAVRTYAVTELHDFRDELVARHALEIVVHKRVCTWDERRQASLPLGGESCVSMPQRASSPPQAHNRSR